MRSIKRLGGMSMLLEVVARARRRLWWNAVAFQLAIAVIVAFGVLALLLLLGTDLLGWRWVILLPAASLSIGTWIARHRLPGAYPTAQLVDSRLHLSDALSTALFFSRPHPARPDRWCAASLSGLPRGYRRRRR